MGDTNNTNPFYYDTWKKNEKRIKGSSRLKQDTIELRAFLIQLEKLTAENADIVLKNKKVRRLLTSRIRKDNQHSKEYFNIQDLINDNNYERLMGSVRRNWEINEYSFWHSRKYKKMHCKRTLLKVIRLYKAALNSLPNNGDDMRVLMKLA